MAVSRKLIKPITYGEIWIFSLSIAQLLYYYRGDHIPSDPIFGFLRFLIGPCEERGYEIPAVCRETPRERKYTGKNFVLKAYTNLYTKVYNWLASFSINPSCPHPGTCLHYVVSDGGRMFLLGYAFQLGLKLLLQQRRILKKPALLKQIIFSFDTMRLGALFSFFNVIFKTVMCTLRRQTGRDDKRFAYPAGVLAGVSFLFFRDNTIALYFMWKTFNIMYNKAVTNGYVWDVPFSTEILYSFSTAVLFHAGVLEPANLRPSYWRFLKAISGGRLEKLQRSYLDVFGFGTMDQLKSVLHREKGHSK